MIIDPTYCLESKPKHYLIVNVNMPTKSSRELFKLESFLSILFGEQAYTILQPAPPLPDVIIQMNGRKIGIEITDISDEEIRQREASQNSILDEAQNIFESRCALPIHVGVDFVETASWKKKDCQQVGKFLAGMVNQHLLLIKDVSQYKESFDIQSRRINHSHIEKIRIFYKNTIACSAWSPNTGFCVPRITVNHIQEIINGKNRRVAGYLTGCDEVWLFMFEIGGPSSYFEGFDDLQEACFVSDFARTLIARNSKGKLITLLTRSQV
jgi:hypothetical protein